MSHLANARQIDVSDEQGQYAGQWRKWITPDGHEDWMKVIDIVEEEIIEEDDDGLVERDGMIFCVLCGELASPGTEDWDVCDHMSGAGCSNAPEGDEEDDYDN